MRTIRMSMIESLASGTLTYQLTPHWKRVSDGEPLVLRPGPHTARIRLTVPPEKSRAALATSLPVKFRVVAYDAKSDEESR